MSVFVRLPHQPRPVPLSDLQVVVLQSLAGSYMFAQHPREIEHTFLFVLDLFHSAVNRPDQLDAWHPKPARYRETYFRHANWKRLRERGTIHVRPYDKLLGRCYEFRLTPFVLTQILAVRPWEPGVPLLHGASNRPMPPPRTRLSTASRNPYPALITDALRAIGPCRFNLASVVETLKDMNGSVIDIAGAMRHLQAVRCYHSVLDHRPKKVTKKLWEYRPAYRVSETGRITHVGGGLQGCPRELKAAAYAGIDGVHNYDIVASQAAGAVLLAKRSGLCVEQLEAFITTPNAKEVYAARAGVSVDLFKDSLYAVLFGSRLPKPPALPSPHTELGRKLRAALGDEGLATVYPDLYHVLRPIYREMEAWRRHLVTEFVGEHGKRFNVRPGVYLPNATGLVHRVDGPGISASGRGRTLAAFLLQGLEAAYIHALTAIVTSRGLVVMSNEHDGLVTLGEIYPHEMEEARHVSGFDNAILMQKPFIT